MSNVTFTNNSVPDMISSCGVGGGLFMTPQLTISASLFKSNCAQNTFLDYSVQLSCWHQYNFNYN